ncbi:alginate lyase family protein [Pseudomonas sp. No.21]|uniref:alginate lyase family protein n=1 Tax=Pseudomonas tohonis TaxID=2725477 RepID=UPI001F15D911|nr:alginate lyase family protein [Pseudomonas tohonis]GJN45673.1 hypothetical protein TUM20249_16590 [Pseudomonas tohonis]
MISRGIRFLRRSIGAGLHRVAAPHRERLKSWLHGLETRQERYWEWRQYLLARQPPDGEMTAILRRNGWPGFYAYLIRQRRGDFGRRNFLPSDRDEVVRQLRAVPGEAERIIEKADRLVSGEFDLLGSGPVDMRRGKRGAGHRIDWNRDPISGERYASVFSQWRWSPFAMRRGNADVKGPWELTRCQHFPALGQAYWLTGDEKYARCYARTIADFIAHTRPGIGVHWACPMDVALRLVSWQAGLSFFQGSGELDRRWWRRFLKSLVQHGRHITANLEFGTLDGRIIVSNHGLANLFGLYWLAMNFPGLDAGCVWRGIAESGLEQQVRLQLLDDGGGFESSVPYHRLVTEMFLSAYALSLHHKQPFSAEYRDRLVKALQFVRALRQDGGRLPQIGDADNGRAHIFAAYDRWEIEQEHMDHLLAAGAAVLGCEALRGSVDTSGRVEALFWRDPWDPVPTCTELPPPLPAMLFERAGVAVLRQGENYVAMSNSVCGTFGIGNHKHNDQLAIEWAIGAQPLFVDAGSYTYTQDPDARNEFRSTATHNTVQVDGEEQHGMDPKALFRLVQQGDPEWEFPVCMDHCVGVIGRNSSYQRLAPELLHERRLCLSSDGALVVEDRIGRRPGHTLRWHFLLHPSVKVTVQANRARLHFAGGEAMFEAPSTLHWSIEEAWYSSGYGVRIRTAAIVAESTTLTGATFVGAPLNGPSYAQGCERANALWKAETEGLHA